ncbi:MAG: hypothetical protein AAFX87_17265 [Bacteroidota bacterium]
MINKMFGEDENGHPYLPAKFSSRKLIYIYKNCEMDWEGFNIRRWSNSLRNWKKYRKHQWKEKTGDNDQSFLFYSNKSPSSQL